MELLGTPTWFGSEQSPLLGWVNQPAGAQARGAVVICPPFGKEHVSSYRTLRMLAEQLADAGLLVLRFDYAGTGDSAGDYHSPNQVEQWLDSVREAVAYVRAAGATSVALVGLRVGALIAAAAAQRCGPISDLVLWDPVVSGKSYLREQKALYRLAFGDGGEQEANDAFAPGLVFLPETARDLGALALADIELSAANVLLLPRPERKADDAMAALAARPDVEAVDATQQAELLDTSSQFSQVPRETITIVADYLVKHAPETAQPIAIKVRDEVTVSVSPNGQSIVERFGRFGPHQLFGIITTTNDATGSTIVCVNPAKEHRVGPARLWPELARAAADEGVRTVRFDRRGVGDSARGDEDVRMYSNEAIEDLRDVVEATCPEQNELSVVGLCSGAWIAMIGAIKQVHPRAVYLVNPALWRLDPPSAHGTELGGAPQLPVEPQGRDVVRTVRRLLKQLMPYPLWLALGRLGKAKVPEVVLAPLLDAGVDVTIFYGTIDAWKFGRQAGWKAVRRLRSRGTMRIVVDSLIEHSLLTRPGRELVESQVISEVAARGIARESLRAGSAPAVS